MLSGVKTCRTLIRVSTALVAATILVVAAPIHSAHGHDESAPSATLHGTCAICQMHAPAGTLAGAPVMMVEPDCFGHFIPITIDEFTPAPRDDADACRAPPSLAS
jgi:hypothetical protein